MPENITSAEQDQWREICAAVRARIAKMAVDPAPMPCCEVLSLTQAMDYAITIERAAATFDAAVEERKAALARAALYGE